MTPFNLEDAKKGKPVVTRDGKTAKYVTVIELLDPIPAPLIMEVDGLQENYYLNGRFETVHEHRLDLFMGDTLLRNMDKVRETGFYWIKIGSNKEWTIGYWEEGEESWELFGGTIDFGAVKEIDERIITRS